MLVTIATLMGLAMLTLWSPAVYAQSCEFALGFNRLHSAVPAVIGDCTGNAVYNPVTGDALQPTANGLLVWRKSSNLLSFTNGVQTWISGPFGIEIRFNGQRFWWEPNPGGMPPVEPPEAGDRCHTAGTSVFVVGSEAAAGNLVATLALTNRLGVPCTFFGYIGAELLDDQENALPTVVVRSGGVFVNEPGPTVVTVPASGSAQLRLHWTQVPSADEVMCPLSNSLAVILPGEYVALQVTIPIRACSGGRLDVSPVRDAS